MVSSPCHSPVSLSTTPFLPYFIPTQLYLQGLELPCCLLTRLSTYICSSLCPDYLLLSSSWQTPRQSLHFTLMTPLLWQSAKYRVCVLYILLLPHLPYCNYFLFFLIIHLTTINVFFGGQTQGSVLHRAATQEMAVLLNRSSFQPSGMWECENTWSNESLWLEMAEGEFYHIPI